MQYLNDRGFRMSKILGLDLGPNSIGWALIDEKASSIISTGVRIFPGELTEAVAKKNPKIVLGAKLEHLEE